MSASPAIVPLDPPAWPGFLDACPPPTRRGTVQGPRLFRSVRIHLWQAAQFRAWWTLNRGAMLRAGWTTPEVNGATYLEQWLMPDGSITPKTRADIAAARQRAQAKQQPLALIEPEIVLTSLPEELEAKLLPRQVIPAQQLARALREGVTEWGYPGAVDLSDVGMGKTYMDLAAALSTGRKVCVLCPLVGKSGWQAAFQHFGAEPYYIGTYEGLRSGSKPDVVRRNLAGEYEWQNAGEIVIILDEAQNVRHDNTLNARMCAAAIRQQIPMIEASATLAVSPLEIRLGGRITGLHSGGQDWERFLLQHGCSKLGDEWKWNRDVRTLAKINARLFPRRGCRLTVQDLGEDAPQCETVVLPVNSAKIRELAGQYRETQEFVERIGRDSFRGKQEAMRAHQKYFLECELALVQPLAERIKSDLGQGRSVAVFVSRTDTQKAFWERFGARHGFFGGQPGQRRAWLTQEFQANRIHLLVNQIAAGGASVSLHDIHGERPRSAYIFLSDNPTHFRQAQGRMPRTGSKSLSHQWLPYCAGVGLHERMLKRTGLKMQALDTLNNGTDFLT